MERSPSWVRSKLKGFGLVYDKISPSGSAATVPANLSQSGSSSISSDADLFFGAMSDSGGAENHRVQGHLVTSRDQGEVTVSSPGLHRFSVAFHIVLHHLCSFYERDTKRREKLFLRKHAC